MGLWWIPIVLGGLTAAGAAFFFALHLGSNEPVPLERARLLWRWTIVVWLGAFDVWIFARVIHGLWLIW